MEVEPGKSKDLPKEVVANILRYLKQIEDENNVKVIYATEFGSRLWGWSSPSSDCDVRFIYIHNIDWYVSINEVEN